MPEPITKKPCIDVCEFKHSICKACGRTKAEKDGWKRLSPEEKQSVWSRVLNTHGQGDSEYARALRARYQKARRKAAEKARDKA